MFPNVPQWRKGQTLFNFLEWLHVEKGYSTPYNSTNARMADPFHIPDQLLEPLYNEYLEWLTTPQK